jgi:uncharacterized caspase-like protein
MTFQLSRFSRSIIIAAAMTGMASVAIGVHAGPNNRSLNSAQATEVLAQNSPAARPTARLALVIGNGRYPDAQEPLTQPINDARAIGAALRREGFDVDVLENASRNDINRAVDRLNARIGAESVVMLFFGGYGIQAGRESFMIPVDAAIWTEADVRHHGISIEAVLGAMKDKGARARIAVIDASRRNPYERRFRGFSHGLAPISAADNALILSSATPGKVADDSTGHNSVLVTELLNNIGAKAAGAEAVFSKTLLAISQATGGEQVPSISSSLLEDIHLAAGTDEKSGG